MGLGRRVVCELSYLSMMRGHTAAPFVIVLSRQLIAVPLKKLVSRLSVRAGWGAMLERLTFTDRRARSLLVV
jgi:hypothetical protein